MHVWVQSSMDYYTTALKQASLFCILSVTLAQVGVSHLFIFTKTIYYPDAYACFAFAFIITKAIPVFAVALVEHSFFGFKG